MFEEMKQGLVGLEVTADRRDSKRQGRKELPVESCSHRNLVKHLLSSAMCKHRVKFQEGF